MAGIREWVAVGEIESGGAAHAGRLRAAQAGDRAAAEELLAPYERPLFALCHGILGHADDAEDAVQETFLRGLRALRGFRGEAAFRTWLYRIAINVCLEWKRNRRHDPVSSGSPPWEEEQSSAPDSASPEAIALRRLQMREALATLMPRHRAILLLKEREGWTMAEIGAVLGCNTKRVEHELSRARQTLAAWRQQKADKGVER
jgi:RNA polymerase sigma-70 factor (ECF subfamily)